MYNPTVSVIVNTHNRGPHLKRLLDTLSMQTYDNFEVIIVNGPSTDNTGEVLEAYQAAIRTEKCPIVNLCVSRNIGVRAAAGEIIAFIDDDAVPQDKQWIENAVQHFQDERVGIVGGTVYRLGGMIEFRYGCFDVWGTNQGVCDEPVIYDDPEGERFSGGPGGNVFFRTKAVLEVGGFDEYFAYYMDESDLCMRIIQAGYTCRYGENMAIIHEAAGGVNRKSEYHKNWHVICKSRGYFIIKASEHTGKKLEERKKIALQSVEQWAADIKWLYENQKISREEYKEFISGIQNGVEEGVEDALKMERKLDYGIKQNTNLFKKYDKSISDGHMNVCLLCEGDCINPIGGVPVYTKALANGLNKMGHNVFVISRGDNEKLNLIEGMNICTVHPEHLDIQEIYGLEAAQTRIDFSYAAFVKLQELKRTFNIQLVESPIWDSLGAVTAYMEKEIPVVTRLQTPFKMMLDTFNKNSNPDYDFLMELEEALLKRSDYIITISDCVKETIEKLYDLRFHQTVFKNYLGIVPHGTAKNSRNQNDRKLVVFFIGRLERRKGIHCIMDAIPGIMNKYPNVEFRFAGDDSIVDDIIGNTYKKKFLKDNRGARWLKQVKFLGKIDEQEKEQEFANCDVFVSPSLYESFGIIFVEAMRYGKPVIGCKIGGMQEVIDENVTGLLAEPNDSASFEACLAQLLEDAQMRIRMGEAGRSRMERMFTIDTMCNECADIYRQIVLRGKKHYKGKN